MKSFYEKPELEIIELLVDDIVTASTLIPGENGGGTDIEDDEFTDVDGSDPRFIYK